jgi:hypothetical protein
MLASKLRHLSWALPCSPRRRSRKNTITFRDNKASMTADEASGFYQQQVAKFKDVLAAPPVRQAHEVCVQN